LPELRAIAPREILTLSPGYADMDLTRLPFRHVSRPMYPLDQDFSWAPVAFTRATSPMPSRRLRPMQSTTAEAERTT
jgi:hypothetical protein